MDSAAPKNRFTPREFWAWLSEVFDNYGILILAAILVVYPFLFDALNESIIWLEDNDWEETAEIVAEFRGFVPSTPLMIQILIYTLFGIAFNILLGNTGMLSLGHCAFFGVGGYTVGIMHAWIKPGTYAPDWMVSAFKVLPWKSRSSPASSSRLSSPGSSAPFAARSAACTSRWSRSRSA